MATYQENDIGIPIDVQFIRGGAAVPLAGTTSWKIHIQHRGTGAVKVFTASVPFGGSDGIIRYIPIAGDLTPKGRWDIQGEAIGAGIDFRTRKGTLDVLGNI